MRDESHDEDGMRVAGRTGARVELSEFSSSPDFEVSFSLDRTPGGVSLVHRIKGDLSRLYPEPLPPLRVRAGRDLWRRTCLEAFFFEQAATRYIELNWNALGEHAVLGFDDYRTPTEEESRFTEAAIERSGNASHLEVRLDLQIPRGCRFRVSPTAVLHPSGGSPLYYALAHGDHPDFHAREIVESVALGLP